jgi:TonB family protein
VLRRCNARGDSVFPWQHSTPDEDIMNSPLRIAAVTGALALSFTATAGAAGFRLVPLSPQTAAVTRNACAEPFAAASVAAAPAVLPEIAVQQHVSGVTAVRVDLDARGRLGAASVLHSSGNRYIDQAALRTARMARYRTEVRDCERVGGAYALVVDFTE